MNRTYSTKNMFCSNHIIIVILISIIIKYVRNECNTNIEESLNKVICSWSDLKQINGVQNKETIAELEIVLTRLPSKLNDNAFKYTQLSKLVAKEANIKELTSNTFNNLLLLRYLDLSNNNIEKLPPKLFQNNKQIRVLILSGNQIQSIAIDAFTSLPDLQDLQLEYNNLTRIDSTLFNSLNYLTVLNLQHNQIDRIDDYTFKYNVNLRSLNLQSNLLTDLKKQTFNLYQIEYDRYYNGTPRITELNLSLNGFKIIKNSYFKLFKYLKVLRIQTCLISTFESINVFKSLTRLEVLFIGYNKLTELPERLLNYQTRLQELNLKSNYLTTIPEKFLYRTTALKILDLQYNRISNLSEQVFSKLNKLEQLWLVGNAFETVPSNLFKSLTNLKLLNIARNKIKIIEPNAFDNMLQLRELFLHQNQIKVLDTNVFFKLVELIKIDLSSNGMEEIKPGAFDSQHIGYNDVTSRIINLIISVNRFNKINKDIFTPLTRTTILKLSSCRLKELDVDIFINMEQLELLELSYNQLTELPVGIFDPLENLIKLDCSRNQITKLDQDLFKNTLSLEEIDFSGNRLITIPVGLLNLPGLREANFNMNKIEYLAPDTLDGSDVEILHVFLNRLVFLDVDFVRKSKLKYFSFGRNPWQCNCLDDLMNVVRARNIDIRVLDYFDGVNPVCVVSMNKNCTNDSNKIDEYLNRYYSLKHELQKGCTDWTYCP